MTFCGVQMTGKYLPGVVTLSDTRRQIWGTFSSQAAAVMICHVAIA
jgi:hypothetical protein